MAGYVPLFQERWRRRPFWMLVGCVLVNRTRWAQARPIHAGLVRECGSAAGLARLPVPYLEEKLRPLGLSYKRAETLVAMACLLRFVDRRRALRRMTSNDVRKLPGCGGYAADSWAIFIEGRRDVKPTDKRLLEFLANARRKT